MQVKPNKERRTLELMLIIIALGITALLYFMDGHRAVALNLFFLPIVLSGYYLGRSSAGVLALFSALCVTVTVSVDPTSVGGLTSPVTAALAVTIWAAALGLTALLVGTLCDERAATVEDLHNAYVGVVEVLSRYLQSANPKNKARSLRVAELSQMVAEELDLPRKQIDDIRVGAMLYGLGSVEITTQVLTKAVDALEADPSEEMSWTFPGTDLVSELGSVLRGAMPLLASQHASAQQGFVPLEAVESENSPLGARIIKAARRYVVLTADKSSTGPGMVNESVFAELRAEMPPGSGDVLDALERVVGRSSRFAEPETALN